MRHKLLILTGFIVSLMLLLSETLAATAQPFAMSNPSNRATQSIPTRYMTLTWARSKETDVINGGSIGGGVEAGRQLNVYSDFVWDNGTYTLASDKAAVPPGYRWASWQQKYGVDVRRLRGMFMFPSNLDSTTAEATLFDPFYDTDLIPINDNLYVYVNGVLKFTGGTNYGAFNGGYNGTSPVANETDGWYIPNGITLNGFHQGMNTIDIIVEERAISGGIGYVMLRFGPRAGKTPLPFLELPFSYTPYTDFAHVAKGSDVGGRINSWFDHTSPNYSNNKDVTLWSGAYYTGTLGTNVKTCNTGLSCYDGHNGIDFKPRLITQTETILAAAAGTVISTTTNPLVTWCKEGKDKVLSCGSYYGNQVWLDHHNGYATLYGHLRAISVTVGLELTASQSLGIMGNTGNSGGTHLHFGLYYDQNNDGKWTQSEVVDPFGWYGKTADSWSKESQYLWQKPLWEQQGVGTSGATLTSTSGNIQTMIPVGALTSTVTIELWDVPPIAVPSAQLRSLGHSAWLRVLDWSTASRLTAKAQATATGFLQPITVAITYSDTETLHLDPSHLTIYHWSEGSHSWVGLPTSIDAAGKQAVATSTEAGNFDLQAPLLCPSDGQEPDDNYTSASAILPSSAPTLHVFDGAQDEDWTRLDVIAGGKYRITTSGLAPGVDTVLRLYDMDGMTVLITDDNSGGNRASRLEWLAPASGTYFIRVTKAPGSASGCNTKYSIAVTQELRTYLPLMQR